MGKIKIGIINVSDRASRGEYTDLPGQEVKRLLKLWLSSPWEAEYAVIPDEQDLLEKELIAMADNKNLLSYRNNGRHGTCSYGM